MTFNLRPYQSRATDAAKQWLKSSVEPCLIDAAPAAGKSFMVAEMATWFREISGGKRVLCLQPNAKLCRQNVEKFQMTGEQCSIFSASAGAKSTRHGVIYATPFTVKNAISRFTQSGAQGFCAVIIDECHELTPTIRAIIDAMREVNPNLRILGLTGTPYVLGKGYIFRLWPDGKANDDDVTRDPYFLKMVYRVSAQEMLEEKFITPMEVSEINAGEYDTSGIQLLPNGTLNHETVERAFEGHGRKTAAICADFIAQYHARGVKGGVMIFAATVRHAQEIMASLPPENSALCTGDKGILNGRDATDEQIVRAYRNQEFRYLVSVGKFTTGFDVDHTVFIVTMRYTESPPLIVQILGRAWRLNGDKPMSYWLDYAGNHARHFGDAADIYSPVIKAKGGGGPGIPIEAECPECGYVNEFSLQPDYADFARDKAGYCLDVFGNQLMGEYGPVAAHYGRRCFGMVRAGSRGEYERCGHRYNSKDCPACEAPNDIAARFCTVCAAEIVDPNERLIGEFVARKKDPTQPQTDRVLSFETRESVSQKGNATIRVDFVTPYRQFSCWFMKEPTNARAKADLARWEACGGNPETVSYVRDADSQFWRILAFGKPADDDELPLMLADDSKIEKLRKYA